MKLVHASLAALLLPALAAGCGAPSDDRSMSANEVAGTLEQLTIEPGLWQVSSEITDVRAPNLPIAVRERMIGPRGTVSHCIAPDQAARPSAGFLAGRRDGRCRYRDFAMENGIMRGVMTCADPDAPAPVETRMIGRYGRTAYVLRMEMANPMPDGAVMRVAMISRGRRAGPCNEENDR